MLRTLLVSTVALTALACGSDPDTVRVNLAPSVVSSQDATIHVHATVLNQGELEPDANVVITVDYVDRNDEVHAIVGAEGVTDEIGAFDAVLEGLDFEGVGTVTATVLDEAGAPLVIGEATVAGTATFSVLDLTPPVITILPPTSDLRVVAGQEFDVDVEVSDEIGISEVFLEADGELERARSTVVASGSSSTTVKFDLKVDEEVLTGTVTLYALAADLSGNLTAAEPIVLSVDPAP